MYCTRCGKLVSTSTNYCSFCGEKTETSKYEAQDSGPATISKSPDAKLDSTPLGVGYPPNIKASRHVIWGFLAFWIAGLLLLPLELILFQVAEKIYPETFKTYPPILMIALFGVQFFLTYRIHLKFMRRVAKRDLEKNRHVEPLGPGEHIVRIVWFLGWRIVLLGLLISLLLTPLIRPTLSIHSDVAVILYRPGLIYLFMGTIVCGFSVVRPLFLWRFLGVEKISLPLRLWQSTLKTIGGFFILCGIGSLSIAKFTSASTWLIYRSYFFLLIYLLFMLCLGVVIKRKLDAEIRIKMRRL